jgi:hypothetical protein
LSAVRWNQTLSLKEKYKSCTLAVILTNAATLGAGGKESQTVWEIVQDEKIRFLYSLLEECTYCMDNSELTVAQQRRWRVPDQQILQCSDP